jgi:ketol-acid reductoisomerase
MSKIAASMLHLTTPAGEGCWRSRSHTRHYHSSHFTCFYTHTLVLVYGKNWIEKKKKNERMMTKVINELRENMIEKWDKENRKYIHPLLGQKINWLQFIALALTLFHLVTSHTSNHS